GAPSGRTYTGPCSLRLTTSAPGLPATGGRQRRWRGRVAAWETPRWQLVACAAMHVVNDALFAGLYPLLPLIATGLGLTYAQVGLIKTAYTGSSSLFQVPAGMAAERFSEHALLALGTGWVGAGLLAMTLATGFLSLLLLTLLAGLGGNVQHPVATGLVSRLNDAGRRGTAIGTLNFAGDVGKVLAPLLVGGASLVGGWQAGLAVLGALGLLFALLYAVTVPPPRRPAQAGHPPAPAAGAGPRPAAPGAPPAPAGWGITRRAPFAALTLIGVLDAAARGAALTFLPFLLLSRGFDAAGVSAAFALLFAAGAAGKFFCGPLSDRYGSVAAIVVTELVTALSLLATLVAPGAWLLVALLPLGFVLNGTSSVLYAAVAGLVDVARRARGYGLYYTCTQLATAIAPLLYGLLADRAGLGPTFVVLAAVTFLIVPLTLVLARDLR
ncbi:MAG TPA: MFS transporter, partial [Chloroflexota bacterium]|nr:MFS transporter [Chloroflexota bacterium]